MTDDLRKILAEKRQHYDALCQGTKKRFMKRSELINHESFEPEKPEVLTKLEEVIPETEMKIMAQNEDETHPKPSMPRKDVIRRLRELNAPILLFGECEYDAFSRLRKLEIAEPDFNESYQNDFREAMARVDEEYLTEKIGTDGKASGRGKPNHSGTTHNIDYFLRMKESLPTRRGEPLDINQSKLVADYLQFILRGWTDQLSRRSDMEKTSTEGKKLRAIHRQTIEYLRPLFKMLRNETLNKDILDGLVSVVRFLIERNYIKANDVYLEIAIGNAPWPIGVTMVGIHARPGREKVSSKYVAHVLNDETQRKFLQAVKRLITQNQELFPTFPHRSVNYIKKI